MDTLIEHRLEALDTEKVNPASTEVDCISLLEIVQVIMLRT